VKEILNILFIADQSESLELVRSLLAETDIPKLELDCVSDRVSAINWFSRNRHDICIIDATENGIDLMAESRRVGFTVPIIMLTGNSGTEVLSALKHGAMDCLLREGLTAAGLEETICAVIERNHNLEAQMQHQRCYLGLVENASDIIYTHDLQGNYTFINKAGEEATGYSQDDLLKRNLSEIVAPETLNEVWLNVLHMLNDHRRARYNAALLTKDGQRIPITVSAHLIYREGIPIGVQGVARRRGRQIPVRTFRDNERRYQRFRQH